MCQRMRPEILGSLSQMRACELIKAADGACELVAGSPAHPVEETLSVVCI